MTDVRPPAALTNTNTNTNKKIQIKHKHNYGHLVDLPDICHFSRLTDVRPPPASLSNTNTNTNRVTNTNTVIYVVDASRSDWCDGGAAKTLGI